MQWIYQGLVKLQQELFKTEEEERFNSESYRFAIKYNKKTDRKIDQDELDDFLQ